jgi:hypothetical protein
MAKFFGGDGKGGEANGALYEFTIFWKFIPEEWYIKEEFIRLSKFCIIFLNIYNFFIRQNSLKRCI